jgi:2-keto-4-pentenoate hydratase/2-oxohepta-3-ene-1,7-dioic acid hydratase in catechol pathway
VRLVRFRNRRHEIGIGILEGDRVYQIPQTVGQDTLTGLLTLEPDSLRSMAGEAKALGSHRLTELTLLAPIDRPPKIVAIGLNYEDHRREVGADVPTEPTVFSKLATAIIGPFDEIELPAVAPGRVDYEAELAVVLKGGGRFVKEQDAMTWVAGYTVANDVSARDWQTKKPGGQWLLGKSFDSFLPLGPAIVTADEVPDPHALHITCTVSGETLQDAMTSELIFRVPFLIAYLSTVFRLEPGDIILTGTPGGVGMARKPPRWLRPGDVVETTIDGVGTMTNPVRTPTTRDLGA